MEFLLEQASEGESHSDSGLVAVGKVPVVAVDEHELEYDHNRDVLGEGAQLNVI